MGDQRKGPPLNGYRKRPRYKRVVFTEANTMYIMEIPKGEKLKLIYQGQRWLVTPDDFGGLRMVPLR